MRKRFDRVPEILLGFDTETTGLSVSSDRAISYGFTRYRFGVPEWSTQYFVLPDVPISYGAQRVHGLSRADLEAKQGREDVVSVVEGLRRAIHVLATHHEMGAWIVGANVANFDLEMLRRSSLSVLGEALLGRDSELNLALLRIIDVIDHDRLIDPTPAVPRRRSLSKLSLHYGVTPGGHDALGDARAAVEVFLEQVTYNNEGQSMLWATGTGAPTAAGARER